MLFRSDLTTLQPNAAVQPPLDLVATMPPTTKDTEPQPPPAVLHNAPERPENDRPAVGTGALVSTVAKLDTITKVTN